MTFWQRFKLAWESTKLPAYVEEADGSWTEEDQLSLAAYFASPQGQKLKLILTNYVLKSAVDATMKTNDLRYHCGIARGIALAVVTLQNHFAAVPRQEKQEESQAAPPFFEQELAA